MAKKLYYKIGEACKMLEIQPYVLRYWETEFPALKPDKSKSGQRVYSKADLALIQRIKELLYEEGYTIAGAKKKLEQEEAQGTAKAPAEPRAKAPRKAKKKVKPEAKAPAAEKAAAPEPDPAAGDPAAELERLRAAVREAVSELRAIQKALTG